MNKIAVIILCLVTLLTAAVGTTLAYLTDSESSGEMVFVSGSVSVELDVIDTTLVPSKPIAKLVSVTNTGTSDAYVRLRVWIPKSLASNSSGNSNIIIGDLTSAGYSNPTINEVSDSSVEFVEYTFVYNTILAAGNSTADLSENIVIAGETSLENVSTDIRFYVDAIQASMFDNVTAAFEAFEEQESETQSTNP